MAQHLRHLTAEIEYRRDRISKEISRHRPTRPGSLAARRCTRRGRDRRPCRWMSTSGVPEPVRSAMTGIMGGVAVHTASRPDRTRRRADGARFAARRPVVCGQPRPSSATPCASLLAGDAGVGKTRLLAALATARSRPAGASSPATASTSATARCPTCPSPSCSAGSQADLPTSSGSVAEAHPALARLQPGRRVLVVGRRRVRTGRGRALDRADLFEAVHAAARGGRRRRPGAAGRRGLPLGRPVHPRPAQLPVLPPLRGAGRRRGVLPLRRPAPPAPAPPPGRRVVAAARRRAAPARAAARRRGPAADPSRSPERDHRGRVCAIVEPAEGNAFFVEELVGAAARARQLGSRRPRRRAAGPPRPARRRRPPGGAGGQRRRPPGRPRACWPRSPDCPTAELDGALRRPWRSNVLVPGDDTYAFRHALLGEAVYDDLLPGERVRLHAPYAEALREGRAAAPPPSWPGTRGWPTTSTPRSTPASGPATRRWRSAAPTRPPTTTSRRSSCSPTRARRSTCEIDISKLAVSAAEALTTSGQPTRAAKLLAEQLEQLARGRARRLAGQAARRPRRRASCSPRPSTATRST